MKPLLDHNDDDDQSDSGADRLRLDKWLWYARFLKTRSLAAKLCGGGVIRCSGTVVSKAHFSVKPGDVLTFPQGRHIRVIKVLALGERRGPAVEAQTLYEDLSPPMPETAMDMAMSTPRPSGRPNKRDRRALGRLKTQA